MKEQDLIEKISSVERKEISSTKLIDQCVQIAKDYAEQEAIEFAEWSFWFERREHNQEKQFTFNREKIYTTSELYQLFKNRENER